MTDLYALDEGWHGYTRGGDKAHRIYRPSRFPQRLTACAGLPVVYVFSDDMMPDSDVRGSFRGWCLHCYPSAVAVVPL